MHFDVLSGSKDAINFERTQIHFYRRFHCRRRRLCLRSLIKAGEGRESARRLGRIGSFARVFVASPLSRALDKTAMLCRLGVSVSLAVKIVCLRLS